MYELNDFDSIQIRVASPEKILEWSRGEVTKAETINYRTNKPERDGLFCERIFGPVKDWECRCGRYKKTRNKGKICEKCGVELTLSKVRRERMGHIALAAPVTHIWYLKGLPSRIATILDMNVKNLEQVVYFGAYVVLDPGKIKGMSYKAIAKEGEMKGQVVEYTLDLTYKQIITDIQLREIEDNFRYAIVGVEADVLPELAGKEFTNALEIEELKAKYGNDVVEDSVILEEATNEDRGLKVGMGAESVRELLQAVDLEKECAEMRAVIDENPTGQKRAKAIKRLSILEAFRRSGNKPEWMILTVLPVIPPDLRPMVPLDGGRFAASDLNDLYRRVIMRNNRLKKLLEIGSPDIIVKNEKRMLQECVDALIDNGKRGGKAASNSNGREYKSLSVILKGKSGRFRQNLLGKRVDYSGRSVIVVGPDLKLYQCGVPKEMAIELFKPFVMKRLVEISENDNIKSAKKRVEKADALVWDILEDVIKEHPVLLNRAPTLHRLSIQAFEPVLIEGRAIKIHPLVCGAFNADFDGDQMAIHVPLSIEAQTEARFLMLSSNNILKLSDGKPVMSPSQDMVLGSYYLTIIRYAAGGIYDGDNEHKDEIRYGALDLVPGADGLNERQRDEAFLAAHMPAIQQAAKAGDVVTEGRLVREAAAEYGERPLADGHIRTVYVPPLYVSEDEALMAYQLKQVHMEDEIYVRRRVVYGRDDAGTQILPEPKDGVVCFREENGDLVVQGTVKTTVGRIIFNNEIPQDLGFVKREEPADYLKYEISYEFIDKAYATDKKKLAKIVDAAFKTGGAPKAATVLDNIKTLGYKYSTIGALTTSVFDMTIPESKADIIEEAEKDVAVIERKFNRGALREEDRHKGIVDIWQKATQDVQNALKSSAKKFNPIWMMADSGARGSIDQIKQLSGMRGLMVNPQGEMIEVPVKSSFRQGLTVLEYFISSHGGRKGLADTALKTADSGYLTRRLVDVAQNVVVREEDCAKGKTIRGMRVRTINGEDGNPVESLEDRIRGRFAAEDVVNPATGEVIVACNEWITDQKAKEIVAAKIDEVNIRSVFTCNSRNGVCAKCYGTNMATNKPVMIGEAVGVIAAQSIGEPGTQLTMRTFHMGGIAATGDITQGLPRVEELFEARKPSYCAVLADVGGVVRFDDGDNHKHVFIHDPATNEILKEYELPYNAKLNVHDGDVVKPGDFLNKGSAYPQDILDILATRGVQDYILEQVQTVYRSQGVEINDKHVEVIVRQMLRKVRIEDPGDTDILPGALIDMFDKEDKDMEALERGGRPSSGKRVLLGIAKAAVSADSFLSAASFQETSRVLTDAAVNNKRDFLRGLKENVILGKLIPAGTGAEEYRNVTCSGPVSTRDEDYFHTNATEVNSVAESYDAADDGDDYEDGYDSDNYDETDDISDDYTDDYSEDFTEDDEE